MKRQLKMRLVRQAASPCTLGRNRTKNVRDGHYTTYRMWSWKSTFRINQTNHSDLQSDAINDQASLDAMLEALK
jgi:hypothetical protein